MSMELPSIFGYTDYRKFLADYYEVRKAGVRGYSHRQFSKKAGFSSPNVLKHAIDGTRNIGPDAVEQFIIGLDFKGKTAEYFRNLVGLNQATSDADRQKFFTKMERCIPLAQRVLLQSDAMEYIRRPTAATQKAQIRMEKSRRNRTIPRLKKVIVGPVMRNRPFLKGNLSSANPRRPYRERWILVYLQEKFPTSRCWSFPRPAGIATATRSKKV